MAQKPCAQSLPKLNVTQLNCSCHESKGRFNRIARNAILPFYYNCDVLAKQNNQDDTCHKIFYIKNPQYFSGASNNPGSQVTQAMRYAQLSRKEGRTLDGQRKNLVIPTKVLCKAYPNMAQQWYPNFSNNNFIAQETEYLNKLNVGCVTNSNMTNILRNN